MVPLHESHNYDLCPHINASTIPQRTSMSTTNVKRLKISARSADTMNRYRPRIALTTLHGTTARQNSASKVPTEFARKALARSACIARAKLVVKPHDGHG